MATNEKNLGILRRIVFKLQPSVTPTTLRCFSDSSTQRCNIGYNLVSFSDIVRVDSPRHHGAFPPVSKTSKKGIFLEIERVLMRLTGTQRGSLRLQSHYINGPTILISQPLRPCLRMLWVSSAVSLAASPSLQD